MVRHGKHPSTLIHCTCLQRVHHLLNQRYFPLLQGGNILGQQDSLDELPIATDDPWMSWAWLSCGQVLFP